LNIENRGNNKKKIATDFGVSNCNETDLNNGFKICLINATVSSIKHKPSPTPRAVGLTPFRIHVIIIFCVIVFDNTEIKISKILNLN